MRYKFDMNMLLIEPAELHDDATAHITGIRARHLIESLGAQPNSQIRIGLLNGPRGRGVIQGMTRDAVTVRCSWDEGLPCVPPVDLIIAMPRPKVIKRLWSQLAALGVRKIAVVNAERVERCYFDSHVLAPEFYRPLLIEGLQQSETTYIPEVRVEKRFKVFLEDSLDEWAAGDARWAADPRAEKGLSDAFRGSRPRAALLAVGPETGWSDHERKLLAQHEFHLFTAGQRTLRADTACIALLALVRNHLRPDRPFD